MSQLMLAIFFDIRGISFERFLSKFLIYRRYHAHAAFVYFGKSRSYTQYVISRWFIMVGALPLNFRGTRRLAVNSKKFGRRKMVLAYFIIVVSVARIGQHTSAGAE